MRRTLFILAALLLLAGPSWAIPPFPPGGGTTAGVSDAAYNETTWDGVTDTAPSKNAVRDKFFSVDAALALKCDESVFGTSVGTGLTLDGTTLKASTVLQKYHGVDPSANVLTLLGAADFAAFRTSLSLVPGTNIMAYSAYLADLAGLTPAAGDILYFDGSNWKVLLAGTANYYLKCNGAAAPSWGNTFTGTFGGFSNSMAVVSDGSGNLISDANVSATELGLLNGITGAIVSEGAATGGLIFGDSSPDAAGEIGYASGKFLMYGANSEDFYFEVGSASDTVTAGSNTGVTGLSLGAINLLTTGTIAGRVPIGSDITGNVSLNTTDLIGKVYFVTAACTITLDKVSDVGFGAVVGFYVRDVSETVIIEVDDADKIKLYGAALAAGNTIDSPGAAGDYIFLMSVTDADGSGTDGWVTFGGSGTWTDGGAT